jgi:hypothetical protein
MRRARQRRAWRCKGLCEHLKPGGRSARPAFDLCRTYFTPKLMDSKIASALSERSDGRSRQWTNTPVRPSAPARLKAGLLARGSPLSARPSRLPSGHVWQRAHRSQLRGQPRLRRHRGTHRVPFSSPLRISSRNLQQSQAVLWRSHRQWALHLALCGPLSSYQRPKRLLVAFCSASSAFAGYC